MRKIKNILLVIILLSISLISCNKEEIKEEREPIDMYIQCPECFNFDLFDELKNTRWLSTDDRYLELEIGEMSDIVISYKTSTTGGKYELHIYNGPTLDSIMDGNSCVYDTPPNSSDWYVSYDVTVKILSKTENTMRIRFSAKKVEYGATCFYIPEGVYDMAK